MRCVFSSPSYPGVHSVWRGGSFVARFDACIPFPLIGCGGIFRLALLFDPVWHGGPGLWSHVWCLWLFLSALQCSLPHCGCCLFFLNSRAIYGQSSNQASKQSIIQSFNQSINGSIKSLKQSSNQSINWKVAVRKATAKIIDLLGVLLFFDFDCFFFLLL